MFAVQIKLSSIEKMKNFIFLMFISSNFHSKHLLLFQKLYTIYPYILCSMHKKIIIWSTKHVWILKFDRIDNAQNRLWKLKLPSSTVYMTHIMGVGIEKSGVYHRYMYRLLTYSEKLFKHIPSLSLLEANREIPITTTKLVTF